MKWKRKRLLMLSENFQISDADIVIARYSFKHFFNNIFSLSLIIKERRFCRGKHIDEICDRLQFNKKTGTNSARKHSKSHILYAYVIWNIWLVVNGWYWKNELEIFYGCYTDEYAGKHINRIKRYIKLNPKLNMIPIVDDAETLIKIDGNRKDGSTYHITVSPMGMMKFKRGEHPDIMILDDIMKDERKKVRIELLQLMKLIETFKEEIMSMPKENTGELHVAGTPQDKTDIFSIIAAQKGFDYKEYRAITNEETKEVLWKEMYTYERLMEIKNDELGAKAFNKEYMCSPERSEDAYIKDEEIRAVVNPKLINYLDYIESNPKMIEKFIDSIDGEIYGGIDLGKKGHPSHICLFVKEKWELKDDETNKVVNAYKYYQIGSMWLDRWAYTKQKNLLNNICRVFKVEAIGVDNTRSEFDTFEETGDLDGAIKLLHFTSDNQMQYATLLDRLINYKDDEVSGWDFKPMEVLDDRRQNSQITGVDNDLNAIETSEGHCDSFYSFLLMLMVSNEGGNMIRRTG